MPTTIKTQPFLAPRAIELSYARALGVLISGMMKDCKGLIKIYRDKYSQVAIDASPREQDFNDLVRRLREKYDNVIVREKPLGNRRSGYVIVKVKDKAGKNREIKIRLSDHRKEGLKQSGTYHVGLYYDDSNSVRMRKINQIVSNVEKSDNGMKYLRDVSFANKKEDEKMSVARAAKATMPTDNIWMTTEVREKMDSLGEKWAEKFKEYAETKTPGYVSKILKQSDSQIKMKLRDFYSSKRLELIGEVIPKSLRQVMAGHINENVDLIKSIPEQALLKIKESMYRCLTNGLSVEELTRQIAHAGDLTMRRATLIANDQTRKIFQNLTLRRFQQIGIRKAQWYHTAVRYPREYHMRRWDGVSGKKDGHPNGLNGFIFDLDNPPIIDEKNNIRGYPGQLINCKCGMIAVLDE